MASILNAERAARRIRKKAAGLADFLHCEASIGLFTSIFGRNSEAAVDPPVPQDPTPTEEPDAHAPAPPLKLPDDLMRELFPKGESMVSVVFQPEETAAEPPPLPPAADQPLAEDNPEALGDHPDLLKVPDELRKALFPEQKQMLSVVFAPPSPASVTTLQSPQANEGAKREASEDPGGPIV